MPPHWSTRQARTGAHHVGRRRTRWSHAVAAVALLGSAVACGGESGTPTLTWYINPDPNPPEGFEGAFGQAGIAERCSTDRYTIKTELLPGSASEQRIQLARRLAADDSSIDLMSLDPVFTAEFSDAEFLEPLTGEDQTTLGEGVLQGAIDGASWNGELVVAPLWANTQVLWYRKSVTDAAGLDMSQPVTWEQIITAAGDNGKTVGVQANKYEGYVVWINALIAGAGGSILTDVDQGSDATVTIDSEAGTAAAQVVSQLASSPAAMPDLSVSNEGTVLDPFGGNSGGFIVNWTFTYNNYAADAELLEDIGWVRYPATVEGEQSRPPIGGINIGIGAFSDDPDLAKEAVACMTSEEQQIRYAVETANMPAREGAYDSAELTEQFPEDLLALWRESIDSAGPRPPTPYWSTVVNAVLSGWHPANSVDPESTPASSSAFVSEVLSGDALS